QAVLQYGRSPYAIGFIANLFSKKSIDNNPDAIVLINSSIRRNSIETICATSLPLAARTDTTKVLSKVKVPTLVVRGEEDHTTPNSLTVLLHHELKEPTDIVREERHQLQNKQQPEEFNLDLHN